MTPPGTGLERSDRQAQDLASEKVTRYLARRPTADVERALRILEGALGEGR